MSQTARHTNVLKNGRVETQPWLRLVSNKTCGILMWASYVQQNIYIHSFHSSIQSRKQLECDLHRRLSGATLISKHKGRQSFFKVSFASVPLNEYLLLSIPSELRNFWQFFLIADLLQVKGNSNPAISTYLIIKVDLRCWKFKYVLKTSPRNCSSISNLSRTFCLLVEINFN